MRPPKLLVMITLCCLVSIGLVGFYRAETAVPAGIAINTKGQPTIGYPQSRVQVVVFEEPKCVNCKIFSEEIFPKIKTEYIDTGKVRYTLIPVAFLPGSMPAAVALLGVYYQDPLYPNSDLFFTYLDYMYAHQPNENLDWATTDQLIAFAKDASEAIDTEKLQNCINKQAYRVPIEKNTMYGKNLMGGSISTPTVYVNGIEVKELDYEHVKVLIDKVLQEEGAS